MGSFWSGPMWEMCVKDMGADISRDRLPREHTHRETSTQPSQHVQTLELLQTIFHLKKNHYLLLLIFSSKKEL